MYDDKASFLVKVDYIKNASIQGSIHWLEEDKITRFKSMMELITLIIKAIPKEEEVDWNDLNKIISFQQSLDETKL